MSRITAIIPAHNEADRISEVLHTITTFPRFDEVIVVDDGSTDNTAQIVTEQFPSVRLIRNKKNLGKGASMDKAVLAATGDIIFFADADVHGLTHEHLDAIISPVVDEKYEMYIGMRNRSIYTLRWVLSVLPLVGGERALTKSLWLKLPDFYKFKFRIETGLNFYAKHYGKGYGYVILHGVSQTVKESKYGVLEGIRRRAMMYWDQLVAEVTLQFRDLPTTEKSKWLVLVGFCASLLGFCAGLFLASLFSRGIPHVIASLVALLNLGMATLKLYQLFGLVVKRS